MAGGKSWIGDWHARLYERVREKGYETLTSFAGDRPLASSFALASELGSEDINAIQVIRTLREEAERDGTVDRFARSHLVRELHEALPSGWGEVGSEVFRSALSAPLGSWVSDLPESVVAEARAVARLLMEAQMPLRWLPQGPDDPVLIAFFDRVRGRASS
jgi:hypothetical protein